jgi:hypothetical protein
MILNTYTWGQYGLKFKNQKLAWIEFHAKFPMCVLLGETCILLPYLYIPTLIILTYIYAHISFKNTDNFLHVHHFTRLHISLPYFYIYINFIMI